MTEQVTITKESLMDAMTDTTTELVKNVDDPHLTALLIVHSGVLNAKLIHRLFDVEEEKNGD